MPDAIGTATRMTVADRMDTQGQQKRVVRKRSDGSTFTVYTRPPSWPGRIDSGGASRAAESGVCVAVVVTQGHRHQIGS